MMKYVLILLLLIPGFAHAQSMAEVLSMLDEKDPIKLLTNYNEALNLPDPLTRSIVLQRAIANKNGRIKMLGLLKYIQDTPKDFVELGFTDDMIDKVRDDNIKNDFRNRRFLSVHYINVDQKKNTFTLRIDAFGEHAGYLNQAGMQVHWGSCKLQFDNASQEKILGNLNCPAYKVTASINLR